ncbi:MAG: prepilin peptidase [Candidatus Micrarchaeia archaeon]
MYGEIIRIIILILIAGMYAYFDLFNKREIPNIFAYLSIVISLVAVVLLGGDPYYILFLAALIAFLGYISYEKGFVGGGDIFEFVAITLLIPIQTTPYLIKNIPQLGLPFIFSVFIASGYSSVVIILIYYLIFAKRTKIEKKFKIEKQNIKKSLLMIITYIILAVMLLVILKVSIIGVILLLLIAILSSILIIYEKLINYRMVTELNPNELVPEDMIAINLMTKSEIAYFKKKSKFFGRLATKKLISDIKDVRRKIPVYRNAAPLAAFILIGIILSLLLGNIILLII